MWAKFIKVKAGPKLLWGKRSWAEFSGGVNKVDVLLGGHLHLFCLIPGEKILSCHYSSTSPFVGTSFITFCISSTWLHSLPNNSSCACLISVNSSSNTSSDSLCCGKEREKRWLTKITWASEPCTHPQPRGRAHAWLHGLSAGVAGFLLSPHSHQVWLQDFLFLNSSGSWSWNILRLWSEIGHLIFSSVSYGNRIISHCIFASIEQTWTSWPISIIFDREIQV